MGRDVGRPGAGHLRGGGGRRMSRRCLHLHVHLQDVSKHTRAGTRAQAHTARPCSSIFLGLPRHVSVAKSAGTQLRDARPGVPVPMVAARQLHGPSIMQKRDPQIQLSSKAAPSARCEQTLLQELWGEEGAPTSIREDRTSSTEWMKHTGPFAVGAMMEKNWVES